MPIFFPDTCLPHDPVGFGQWRIKHELEHQQLRAAANALTPPFPIPEFDFGYWNDDPRIVSSWLNKHNQTHVLLRQPGAITGVDLSAVDFTDDGEWADWQNDHSEEHQLLRQFYGIT